jgi:serine phosphatase RsbU (regulator of sigma subunit)
MPSLILIKSPAGTTPQTYALPASSGGKVIIGRQKDACDIVIDDGEHVISRQHAIIYCENGKLYYKDTSRNYSTINNKQVTPASGPQLLAHEDRVKISNFLFRYQDERPPAPAPLPQGFLSNLPPISEPKSELSTVHHSIAAQSARQLLELQPSERLRVLLEISTTLAKNLDLDTLLPQIADTLYGVFKQADRCFIIQVDERNRLYAKVFRARRANTDDRFSRTIIRRCLDSMEAYLSEDASSDQLLEAAQSIAEFRIRSVMCVPLINSAGVATGAIQLDTQDITKKFREDDLKLLTIVANLASVSVEKAETHLALMAQQKVQNEIELARKVQLGILPQFPPIVEGYEFYGYYSAAQTVGGDYYDYIRLPDGRIAVVLGDVAGKGVAASLLMAKLSAESRFCVLTQSDPARAIALLNQMLFRGGIGDRFVTLVAAIVDPLMHTITVVNAGHMTPYHYRHATCEFGECEQAEVVGFPLGIMEESEYTATTFHLGVGDCIALFTDGVTDAMNPQGEGFDFDGLRRCIRIDPKSRMETDTRPRAMGERIVQAVRNHAAGRAQNDDIALVCFGRLDPNQKLPPSSGVVSVNENTRSAIHPVVAR